MFVITVLAILTTTFSIPFKIEVHIPINTADVKNIVDWYQTQRRRYPSINPEVGPVIFATRMRDQCGSVYTILFDVKGTGGFISQKSHVSRSDTYALEF